MRIQFLLLKNIVLTELRNYWLFIFKESIFRKSVNTEAKRCFAAHDEDMDYFNMRIYIILIACVYIQQFNFVP